MTYLMLSEIGVILLVLGLLWLVITRSGNWISPPPEPYLEETTKSIGEAVREIAARGMEQFRAPESKQARRARRARELYRILRKKYPTRKRHEVRTLALRWAANE